MLFQRKFFVLLWKNALIRKHHWIITILETLFPILLVLLFYVFRKESAKSVRSNCFNEIIKHEKNTYDDFLNSLGDNVQILYAPENEFTEKLLERTRKKLSLPLNNIYGYPSKENLTAHYRDFVNNTNTHEGDIFIVIFEGDALKETNPKKLRYVIKNRAWYFTDRVFELESEYNVATYLRTGFLGIQITLDLSFIELVKNKAQDKQVEDTLPFNISIEQFPDPPHCKISSMYEPTVIWLALSFIASFVIFYPALIKYIVEEKRSGLTELLKMTGLKPWMLWLSWFLYAFIVNFVSIMVILIIISIKFSVYRLEYSDDEDITELPTESILTYSNYFLVAIFLFLYNAAYICFCFFLTCLFKKPVVAQLACSILSLLTFLPMFFKLDGVRSKSFHFLMSLLPNTAIAEGFNVIAIYEGYGDGLTFSNLFVTPKEKSNMLNMAEVYLMLIIDIILFSTLTWYLSNIMPGKLGLALPLHFPFKKSYWLKSKNTETTRVIENISDQKNYEKSANMKAGIQIRKLTKKFGTKVAVNNLNIDIYEGQITALLGHNGAGKTTLISMITGMFSQTSGKLYVNDNDTRTEMDEIRDSLSICPQHDLLFSYLTVIQHLIFFAMLKGQTYDEAKRNADQLLAKLRMAKKDNDLTSKLSGGMKRKLCLGIALIGDTNVLLLDEPTSGMDPEIRREVWDLLLKMRGQKTIIISTHFMEEADVLGDRIAIMDHGELQCYGTSIFLKNLYSTGYHLSILTTTHTTVKNITDTIVSQIKDTVLKSHSGSLLVYMLPTESMSSLINVLKNLEVNKKELGISSIGLSIMSLEEVFIRVEQIAQQKEDHGDVVDSAVTVHYEQLDEYHHSEGLRLLFNWMYVLFKKRLMFMYRKKLYTLGVILIPILLAILISWGGGSSSNINPEKLVLSPKLYSSSKVIYTSPAEGNAKKLADAYASLIPSQLQKSFIESSKFDKALTEFDVGGSQIKGKSAIAAEFNESAKQIIANGLFSSGVYHSAPVSLNMLSNAIIKYVKNSSEYSIVAINSPVGDEFRRSTFDVQDAVVILPFGILLFLGSFMYYPMNDRVSNVKQLIYMAGVPPYVYWITCFLCDIILYLIISSLMLSTIWMFNDTLSHGGLLFLLFFIYGMSGLSCSYIFSYLKNTIGSCFNVFFMINIIFGIVLLIILAVFQLIFPKSDIIGTVSNILYILPHFCITSAMQKFTMLDEVTTFSHDIEAVSLELKMLIVDFILYTALIFLIDYSILSRTFEYLLLRMKKDSIEPAKDDDVKEEITRVCEQLKTRDEDKDILLAHNLKKRFGWNINAVRGIYFGVQYNECFGLLGVNGAGKTTTFRMLTGDLVPTSGTMGLENSRMDKNKSQYLRNIGYCPQFNAINEYLTAREMLLMFAIFRGLPKDRIQLETQKWLSKLRLLEYADSLCGTYSGGNKRKLSTAIAMIGDPKILLLDEPTSGVDPAARRNLWNILADLKKEGQSIVLTSHSMEECEALCDRLVIMVEGQFVCIGSIQYLKNKFCQGFTIKLKLNTAAQAEDVEHIKNDVENMFPCELKDEHQGFLHYHVTDTKLMWYKLFENLENLKTRNKEIVEDYTVGDTTLEEIFLSFAKMQTDKTVKIDKKTTGKITPV